MAATRRRRRGGPPGKGGGVPADGQAMAFLLGGLGPAAPADGDGERAMTQAEWESCPNPRRMAAWLLRRLEGPPPPGLHAKGCPTGRRLRLFACAVARLAGASSSPHALAAVGAAERFCQEGATPRQWTAAQDLADRTLLAPGRRPGDAMRHTPAHLRLAHATLAGCLFAAREAAGTPVVTPAARADALRDLFGTPFFGASPASLWRGRWASPQARSLAEAAWEDRRPSGLLEPLRLAVLADCLEEMGADGRILAHLRAPGPHFLGCWAIDLVLGRD